MKINLKGPTLAVIFATLYWGCLAENAKSIKLGPHSAGNAYLTITPNAFNFGSINAGAVSATQTFTITNSGQSSAFASGCTAATLVGPVSSAFTIMADTCAGNDLMQNANCTIDVRANPSYPGGFQSARLQRNCTRGGLMDAPLTLISVVTPSLSLTPLNFDFGNVSVNETTPVSASFTITNTGSQAATGCATAVLGGVNANNFAITSDTCGTAALAISASCMISVSATPSAVGARTATLSRFCAVGGSISTAANGILATGILAPKLALNQSTLDLGRVAVGATSVHQDLIIQNTGLADATGCTAPALSGTDAGEFAIVTDGCGVADVVSGGNCTMTVRAAPTSAGLKRATLTRTCTTGGAVTTTSNGIYAHAKSSFLNFVEAHLDGVGGVDGLAGAHAVALSPDQKFIYVASPGDDGISLFSRDLLTGKLTFISAFLDNTGGANSLDGVGAVSMSGDAKFLYATSAVENALTVFSRNITTGALTFVEEHIDGAGGVDGLMGASSVKVSHDGSTVYAAGETDNAIAVFTRHKVTGLLTYSTMLQDGGGGVDALAGVAQLALSFDGKSLYSAAAGDNAVGVFDRHKTTGALTYSTLLQDGVGGVDGILGLLGVSVSLDGTALYASGTTDNAQALFTRAPATGVLTFDSFFQDGAAGVDGLASASETMMSPDHLFLVTSGRTDNALALFARNPSDLSHSFMSFVQDGVGAIDGLGGAQGLSFSPDGRHFYATGSTDNALAVLENQFKPSDIFQYEEAYQNGGGITGMSGNFAAAVSADGLNVYVASATDDAVVVFSRDTGSGALTFVESKIDGVGGVNGLDGARSVAVSPDGLSVYVAGALDDAVSIFSRNTLTGALTYVGVMLDQVGGVTGLDGASSVLVSADNSSVYVAGTLSDAVVHFSRNAATSALTFVASYVDGASGVDGLDGVSSLASPNQNFIYAVGAADNAVAVFARNTVTGALTFSSLSEDSVGGVTDMLAPSAISFSSDGALAFVSASTSDAVVSFTRSTVTGALSFVASYVNNTGVMTGLDGASAVAVAAGDKYLLVSGATSDALVVFVINSVTGTLRFLETITDTTSGVDALDGVNALALSPNGYHLYAVGNAESKLGLFTLRPKALGHLFYEEKQSDGVGGVTGLDGATHVAISPDGRHLYASGYRDDALSVFSRDLGNSRLTLVETHVDGAGGVDGLNGAISVAISPDGQHVYVASKDENALAVFSRNTVTGALTYVESHKDNFVLVDGLNNVREVVVSPDGNHVYAVGYTDDAVAIFTRNQITGALTYSTVAVNGAGGVLNMNGPSGLALSPDGNFLYVASSVSEAITVFTRNALTGLLTYSTSYVDGAGGISGMGFTYSLSLSADGNTLYAIGLSDNSVVLFARNGATGALTYGTTYTQGADGILGMSSPRKISLSPDGTLAVVSSYDDNALAIFLRNPADGGLSFVERKVDGSSGVDGLSGAQGSAFSPDGRSFYATGENDDALSVFTRP